MWPRVVEVMLGCWLMVAPFVFRGTPSVEEYAATAVASGAVIAAASLLSFWPRARVARLATLAAAVWLAAHGYFSAPRPGPPAAQNEIVVGLVLLLFAILPNETNQPPVPWRRRGERS